MANKPKRKKVTQLPLIADCRISKSSNPALVAHHVFPTLTAQLELLGGEINRDTAISSSYEGPVIGARRMGATM